MTSRNFGPCPRCGEIVLPLIGVWSYDDADRPNFCGHCGAPLTPQAVRQRKREYAETLVATVAPVVDRLIDKIAAELEIDPKVARGLVLLWAEHERERSRQHRS
jgi:hypothetical protein